MKNLLPFLAVALLAPAAAFAANFEGKLTLKITSPEGRSQPLSLSVKDTLTRMEMPGGPAGGAVMIMDSAKHEITMIMPQRRMFMVQPLPEGAAAPAAAATTSGSPAAEPVLEKSATTEKILGYDCVKYVVHDHGTTTELWLADQLGTFSFMGMGGGGAMGGRRGAPRGPGGGAPAPQGWERLLQGKDLFPLRVVSTSADGKVSTFEVVSLEKQAQPAADFAPPADYQDMGAMMKGMGMPGGMPPGLRPPSGG